MYTPKMSSRLAVEALGTFWLVFIGCGSAIFNAKFAVQALDGSRSSSASATSASPSPSASP